MLHCSSCSCSLTMAGRTSCPRPALSHLRNVSGAVRSLARGLPIRSPRQLSDGGAERLSLSHHSGKVTSRGHVSGPRTHTSALPLCLLPPGTMLPVGRRVCATVGAVLTHSGGLVPSQHFAWGSTVLSPHYLRQCSDLQQGSLHRRPPSLCIP